MPIEIRELVINASLKEQAKGEGPSLHLLHQDDLTNLEQKIASLEKQLADQAVHLEKRILKECFSEVKALFKERDRQLR